MKRDYKKTYESLPEETKDKMAWSRGKRLTTHNEVLFVENSSYGNELIKSRIIEDRLIEYVCTECGLKDNWNGKIIILDLDHINGINSDNRLENLRFLCPNCHSQTPTYKGRNKNKGVKLVSDENILEAYKDCGNIRKTLIMVGLAPKGGNYLRVKKLIGMDV